MRRLPVWLAALSAVCAIAGTPAAHALEVGGRVVVAANVPGLSTDPLSPAAAYDHTLDRYLVVWLQVGEPAGATTNVWGRFVTADGEPFGAPFLAATVNTGIDGRSARDVQALYDPVHREFLLLLSGLRSSSFPDDFELHAQWLDDQGARIGGSVAVSWMSAGTVLDPAVVADPDSDRFVVAYEVRRPANAVRTIAVQELRRGRIGPVTLPFGAVPANHPSLAITGDGTLRLAARSTATTGAPVLRVAALASTLAVAGPEVVVPLPAEPTAGPIVRWHPERAQTILAWGDASGAALAELGDTGAPGPAARIPAAGAVQAVDVRPLRRDARWLAVTRAAGSGALTVSERTLDGTSIEGTLTAGEPAPFGPLIVDGHADVAVDSTRTWGLVPHGVRTAQGRAVLARVVAASPPQPLVTAAASAPSVQRCAAGATLYLPATGSACGPAAIGAFTVAPIMPRSRRRLLGVAVQPTGLGQRVRIECVARCGRTRPVLAAKSKRGATDVMFDGWRVPRLATIEVRVEQPDTTTRYRRFSVRRTFPFLVDRGGGCRLPIGIEAPC